MFQATIIGRIGQTAPYQGQSGQFLRIRVAVPIRQRGGQDRTEWATVFTPRMELAPYLTQGRQILVTGNAQIDVYNNQASLTIHASHVELLAESMRGQIANLLPQLLGAQPTVSAQPVTPQAQPTMAQAPESAPAQPAVDPNLLAQALARILGGNRAQPQAQTQNTAEVQAQSTTEAQTNNAATADAIPEAAPF